MGPFRLDAIARTAVFKSILMGTRIMGDQMTLRGTLSGHGGWATQIATTPQYPDMILSASRDKTLIMWKLTRDETNYGVPQRSLRGHNHFVSDVVMSSDGQFALSGSWDGCLRLCISQLEQQPANLLGTL